MANNGNIELPNQEKLRIIWEKETYKFLVILKADIIKPAGMKEKKNSNSGERENYSNQSTLHKSHQKDKHLGYLSRKIFGIILNVDEGRTWTKESENKKDHDDA